jgi:hypothetical protein
MDLFADIWAFTGALHRDYLGVYGNAVLGRSSMQEMCIDLRALGVHLSSKM